MARLPTTALLRHTLESCGLRVKLLVTRRDGGPLTPEDIAGVRDLIAKVDEIHARAAELARMVASLEPAASPAGAPRG